MQNQLAKRTEFMNPVALEQINHLAARFIKSKALPSTIENGDQLAMVLMAGYEAGMTPMQAINSFYIVNGKITIWGSAVIQQVRKAGWTLKWGKCDETTATVTISKGKETCTETYTIEEAAASGLTGKGTWQKYKKEMLRHKVAGRAVRFTCPEVLNGFYLKEEIDATDVEATVVEAEVVPKLDPKKNREIHALWKELMDLRGLDEEKREDTRKATLKKLYGVDSNNNLTRDQAKDFVARMRNQIKDLEPQNAPESDDDTPNDSEDGNAPKASEDQPQPAEQTTEKPAEEDIMDVLPEDMGGNKKATSKAQEDPLVKKYNDMTRAELIRLLADVAIDVPANALKPLLVTLAIGFEKSTKAE